MKGPEFQKVDLGVSSCFEIGRRVYAGAIELYVSQCFSILENSSKVNIYLAII
jgi:hypothetical protein